MPITRNSSNSTPAGSCKSPLVTITSRPSSPQKQTADVEISAIPGTETPIVPPPVSSGTGFNGCTHHLLRSWGIRWAMVAIESIRQLRLRPEREQRKIAIYHGVWYLCIESLFHLIPIGIGIGLVSLNLVGHYVGRDFGGPPVDDSVKLVGFQIAAKMVELLCVASIARFILAFVRHELVGSCGIPFGILASSLDFSHVTYPLSQEFWSVVLAPNMQAYRRGFFVLALGLGTILATLIGPTTAILLQPRLGWWPAGGTDVWIDATQDALFPSVINSSSIVPGFDCEISDHENCPSAGWEALAGWLKLLRFSDSPGPSAISSSGLTLTIRGVQSYPTFAVRSQSEDLLSSQTWMFVPNVVLSRAFASSIFLWYGAARESQSRRETNFADYQDIYYSMIALAPGTATRCNTTVVNPGGKTCVNFPSAASSSAQDSANICDNAQLNEWMGRDFASNDTQQPHLHWIDGSWDGPNDIGMEMPNGFSGAALITVPGQNGASDSVVGCTMHTHYATLTYHKGVAISHPTALMFGADTHTNIKYVDHPATNSTVQASWLNSLNPPLPKINSTVFEQLVDAGGARGDESSAYAPYANRFEAVLLFMVGNGLARMQSLTYPITDVKDRNGTDAMGPWWRSLLPQRATFGAGGDAYNVTAAVRQRAVTNRLFVAVYGHAYAYFDSSGSLWSIIIVLTYVLFAVVLFSVLLRQGCYSSSSWGSVTELNALALESEPLGGDFVNTTAGINTLGPLKRNVRVAVRDDRLQIVAANDRRLYDMQVKGNVEY
ncbi:hypothetical protein CC80DRAFT_572971 [Byssothecium circinans]|uniref:Uncharacterized protein n=1 Tax=Byssothecium circinans TaxID=147558 RepID=A0A6A5TGH8_9PLEO|nr:hypothetical protein CC80DRAFT_572971 [Byssothecium circinans]